ncbi:peroxiredoxin [Aquirhabdus parva]|uniref:thioredoxin-dependent peroxiredoxin n=1 Tax=Aquirhabdus parva TaxID=2283318 RepID=A0A345PB84_9GAMM|nr:peroxiredoxin [Aquirhabdus parva]AXI04543.1 peroxiredoxin [Aquirhabdus parva]
MLNLIFSRKLIPLVCGFGLGVLGLAAQAETTSSDLQPKTLLNSNTDTAKGEWVGTKAPDFRLQDQNQQWHSLKDYQGKWLVLYFYPLDDSPGCTEEARQFRDLYPTYVKQNITVLGVSLNDVSSHKAFADKLGLPFPLLADTQHDLAKSFKVLRGFGPLSYSKRETFLIDPQGVIVYHYASVNTESHAGQVLKDIAKLSSK